MRLNIEECVVIGIAQSHDILLLIAQDVGFLIVKTVVVGRIVEYSDVSEPEESEKQNEAARHLYRSFGFAETGEMDGEEQIAVLKL